MRAPEDSLDRRVQRLDDREADRMIRTHCDGILAWTRLRVANGALEGMNNKVKVISHRAYGFRRPANYFIAIWHGCRALPCRVLCNR